MSPHQVSPAALTDLIVATLALKYTQSNSVCFAYRGGTIGLGAGQQSRIHCTRLAGSKADAWWLRHHPRVQKFEWRKGIKRADRANGTDVFVTGEIWEAEVGGSERNEWEALFAEGKAPAPFTKEEKDSFFKELAGKVSLASDAFFPFPDNVWRATRSGVGYFAAPGGSVMDDKIIETADESNAVYIMTSTRCAPAFAACTCTRLTLLSSCSEGSSLTRLLKAWLLQRLLLAFMHQLGSMGIRLGARGDWSLVANAGVANIRLGPSRVTSSHRMTNLGFFRAQRASQERVGVQTASCTCRRSCLNVGPLSASLRALPCSRMRVHRCRDG